MKYKNKNYDLPVIIEAEQYSPDKPCAEVYPTTAEDPAYLINILRGKSIWNQGTGWPKITMASHFTRSKTIFS